MIDRRNNPNNVSYSDDNSITIQEDDTCFLLSIEMPNIREKDISISLERNVLTISGYRSCSGSLSCCEFEETTTPILFPNRSKRQRVSRQLEIDPSAIDIERAMASTWNGCYTLYAPKKRS